MRDAVQNEHRPHDELCLRRQLDARHVEHKQQHDPERHRVRQRVPQAVNAPDVVEQPRSASALVRRLHVRLHEVVA